MTLETFKDRVLPLKDRLHRYASSILGNRDVAQDVVQETLIKVWEKREDLHLVKNLEAWCMTLARNFSFDKLRSKGRYDTNIESAVHLEVEGQTPYQQMEMQDAMAMVHQVLQRLPLKQKEVIQLRDIEGYSYQEIAEMTGYGLNDVKISIHRARNKIKEELTKAFDYGLEKSRSAS